MRQNLSQQQFRKSGQATIPLHWHTTSVGVQVADTDYGGGVYHGRYFNLFHQARDRFWEDLGVSTLDLMHQGLDLTVAELHTVFLESVFYGDCLEVKTRVLWFRDKSLGVAQQIMGADPLSGHASLRTQAEMNLVCTTRGKAVPLPGELKQAVKTFYGL